MSGADEAKIEAGARALAERGYSKTVHDHHRREARAVLEAAALLPSGSDAAVARVLALHRRDEVTGTDGKHYVVCDHDESAWPCPTVLAVRDEP